MENELLLENIDNTVVGFPFHIEIGDMISDMAAHYHNYSELFIIFSGEAIHEVDNEKYKIGPGDVYLVRPNIAHAFIDVNRLVICNIMFKDEAYFFKYDDLRNLPGFQALFVLEPQLRKEQNFQNRLRLDFNSLKHVISFLTEVTRDYLSRAPGFRTMLIANLVNIIVYLSRIYTQNLQKCGNQLLCMANAVAYMESNYSNPISLDDLSLMAGVSTRHFTRVFKQAYGQTPIDYIIRLRIGKALSLLQETDLSIIYIAMECGFSDGSYFSKKFKEVTGMTPLAYRKQFLDYNHL